MSLQKAYMLLALLLGTTMLHASSNLIYANITINCPYSLHLSTLPVYPDIGNIHINYTAQTTSTCGIPDLNGYFSLAENGSTVLNYSQNISNLNQIIRTINLAIVANSIPIGNYTAKIYLHSNGFQNQNTSEFQLLAPARLIITNLSLSSANLNTPLYVYLTLKDSGYYAINSVSLNLSITRSSGTKTLVYHLSQLLNPLSPSESENTIVIVNNATALPGKYTVTANLSYISNTVPENYVSNSVSYVINAVQNHPSVGPVPTASAGYLQNATVLQSTKQIPGISIISMPIYVTTTSGQQVSSILGLTGQDNLTAYLSVPQEFSNTLLFSSKTITLYKNSTQYVQLVFNSSGIPSGTYIIPLNITGISASGKIVKITTYSKFVSYPKNIQFNTLPVSISTQVQSFDSFSTAQATISISSLKNTTIKNATLYAQIPLLVGNLSHVRAYGMPNNVSMTKLSYNIKWNVPVLPPNQTLYAYYSINKLQSPLALDNVQTVFNEPSTASNSSIMKIVRIDAPSLYQNANGTVDVFALYTGTVAAQIKFMLSGGQNLQILNPIAYVNATPNELVSHSFNIHAYNATGTTIAQLAVSTTGASYNETLPLIVLPSQATYTAQQVSAYPLISFMLANRQYVLFTLSILIIITLFYLILRSILARHVNQIDPEDRQRIIRLRDRIKRSEIDSDVR